MANRRLQYLFVSSCLSMKPLTTDEVMKISKFFRFLRTLIGRREY